MKFEIGDFAYMVLWVCFFVVVVRSFPGNSAGKESTCNAGDLVLFLGWEDPLEKE